MARIRQPLYKRGMKLVVVRPISRGTSERLEPGHKITAKDEMREFQRRSLYRRRRLGPQGDPWTKMMLESWDAKLAEDVERQEAAEAAAEAEAQAEQAASEGAAEAEAQEAAEAEAEAEQPAEESTEGEESEEDDT